MMFCLLMVSFTVHAASLVGLAGPAWSAAQNSRRRLQSMDVRKWTYESGRTKMDAQNWTYESGRTKVDLRKCTYESGPTKVDVREWTYESGRTKVASHAVNGLVQK